MKIIYLILICFPIANGIDISGISQNDNATIVQWSATGCANQEFEMVDASSGYVFLKAHHSGKAICEVNGNEVQYSLNTSWLSMMFERRDVGNGYYPIRKHSEGKCLRVESDSSSYRAGIVTDLIDRH
jgi:hypothetical protein